MFIHASPRGPTGHRGINYRSPIDTGADPSCIEPSQQKSMPENAPSQCIVCVTMQGTSTTITTNRAGPVYSRSTPQSYMHSVFAPGLFFVPSQSSPEHINSQLTRNSLKLPSHLTHRSCHPVETETTELPQP